MPRKSPPPRIRESDRACLSEVTSQKQKATYHDPLCRIRHTHKKKTVKVCVTGVDVPFFFLFCI
jgi:hypothetical protein